MFDLIDNKPIVSQKTGVMFWIISVCVTFTLVAKTVTGDTNTFRSTAFEDPINGKRLDAGKVIETRQEASSTKCALACSKNDDCLSFGFCGETSCELYNEDIFSTEHGENILEEDANCKYSGMKKESKPICQQDGVFADIQGDDGKSEFCLISGKRVDTVWGQWGGEETKYDPPDWKLVNRRETVTEAAHEGLLDLGDSERALDWIKFVDQEMTWEDAKANCETLGGTLFSRVDGTEEQLEFLLQKMNGKRHWLGIYTEDHILWKSVKDDIVSSTLLHWKTGQPNNVGNQQKYVSIYPAWQSVPFTGLADDENSKVKGSVCDMM